MLKIDTPGIKKANPDSNYTLHKQLSITVPDKVFYFKGSTAAEKKLKELNKIANQVSFDLNDLIMLLDIHFKNSFHYLDHKSTREKLIRMYTSVQAFYFDIYRFYANKSIYHMWRCLTHCIEEVESFITSLLSFCRLKKQHITKNKLELLFSRLQGIKKALHF